MVRQRNRQANTFTISYPTAAIPDARLNFPLSARLPARTWAHQPRQNIFLNSIYQADFSFGQLRRKSKPAARVRGTCANVPELDQNLCCVAKVFIVRPHFADGVEGEAPVGIVSLFTGHRTVALGDLASSWEVWKRLGVRYLVYASPNSLPLFEPAAANWQPRCISVIFPDNERVRNHAAIRGRDLNSGRRGRIILRAICLPLGRTSATVARAGYSLPPSCHRADAQ